MKIFDTLNSTEAPVTVIDVRCRPDGADTLRALRDFGFIDAARKGKITLCGVPYSSGPRSPRSTRSRIPPLFLEEMRMVDENSSPGNTWRRPPPPKTTPATEPQHSQTNSGAQTKRRYSAISSSDGDRGPDNIEHPQM